MWDWESKSINMCKPIYEMCNGIEEFISTAQLILYTGCITYHLPNATNNPNKLLMSSFCSFFQ